MSNSINLAQLPAPDVVETLDYEVILEGMLTDLRARLPEFNALVESDPAYKLLEVVAYRELLLRQRVNDACRSVMLAYAQRTDLDNLAALFNIKRQIVTHGDPDAKPPIEQVMESDERLRQRVQTSLETLSPAGPQAAYRAHAINADPEVRDAYAYSDEPGKVKVVIIAHGFLGALFRTELIDKVTAALNDERVRPLTDFVEVTRPKTSDYEINALIYFNTDGDHNDDLIKIKQRITNYRDQQFYLGKTIRRSQIIHTLSSYTGIEYVDLKLPASDIIVDAKGVAMCHYITIKEGKREK